MKAKLFVSNADHQRTHAEWIKEGLERHGWETSAPKGDDDVAADMIVMWGWRNTTAIAAARGRRVPILVMERGHLHPRMEWCSMGFNGLGGYGIYAHPADAGERLEEHFGGRIQPWRQDGRYVLIMGQMMGDASLHGLNFMEWAREAAEGYAAGGGEVVFRPHPNAHAANCPDGVTVHKHMPIEESLKGAKLCVTYTSTSGIEAVMAGVPTISCDRGSMAWPVTGHGLGSPAPRVDREEWAIRLSWTQFSTEEIRNGFAWDHLQAVMPTA